MKIVRYGVRAEGILPGDGTRRVMAYYATRIRKIYHPRVAALAAVDSRGRERAAVAKLVILSESDGLRPREQPALVLTFASPNSPNLPAALSAVGVAA